jgi:hypothetical protein
MQLLVETGGYFSIRCVEVVVVVGTVQLLQGYAQRYSLPESAPLLAADLRVLMLADRRMPYEPMPIHPLDSAKNDDFGD